MCPVRQRKYGAPVDGQEQGALQSDFVVPYTIPQLQAMVSNLTKLTSTGDPSVHFTDVEQVGGINNCNEAETAKLLLFSLDSRLYQSLSVGSKRGQGTLEGIKDDILEAMGLNDGSSFSRVERHCSHLGRHQRLLRTGFGPSTGVPVRGCPTGRSCRGSLGLIG